MKTFKLNGISISLPDTLVGGPIEKRIARGQYERAEARAARRLVQPGMRVVEIGAGLGYITSLCAVQAGAENVLALEANPKMIATIRHNLDQNGQGAVALENGAVVGDTHEETTVRFGAGKHFWGSAIADQPNAHHELLEVPAVSIGDVLRGWRPEVLIMDVEGAELGYIDTDWPDSLRYIVMELHPKTYGHIGIKLIMDGLSAAGFAYHPPASSHQVVAFMRV